MTTTPTTSRARAAALGVAVALLFGIAACSSDSGSEGDASASASDDAAVVDDAASEAASSDDAGSEEAATDVDPCQWYTADEMSELLGFPVTMEEVETPQALGVECLYDSQDNFTSVTVRPTTAAEHDQLKATAAQMGIGGAQIDFPGVGDEAYHDGDPENSNPSVSFSAKSGDDAIQVELAAASGSIASVEVGTEITSTIAATALG